MCRFLPFLQQTFILFHVETISWLVHLQMIVDRVHLKWQLVDHKSSWFCVGQSGSIFTLVMWWEVLAHYDKVFILFPCEMVFRCCYNFHVKSISIDVPTWMNFHQNSFGKEFSHCIILYCSSLCHLSSSFKNLSFWENGISMWMNLSYIIHKANCLTVNGLSTASYPSNQWGVISSFQDIPDLFFRLWILKNGSLKIQMQSR